MDLKNKIKAPQSKSSGSERDITVSLRSVTRACSSLSIVVSVFGYSGNNRSLQTILSEQYKNNVCYRDVRKMRSLPNRQDSSSSREVTPQSHRAELLRYHQFVAAVAGDPGSGQM
ncbi:hypothetical protein J6590_038567 [Homalodisca vitripennis]|nr:hypothetical protein J6590_038567 [Homalodisca vitripennis]